MKNKLLVIIFSIVCTAICLVGCVFAWIIYTQRSIIAYTGDVKITVGGYYDIISDEALPVFETQLQSLNNFNDLGANDKVAYKFTITNDKPYSAVLSLAFGDFCHVIFSQLNTFRTFVEGYYATNGTMPTVSDYPANFVTTMTTDLATRNTAKLTLVIEDAYYVNGSGVTTQIPDDERYLWKYSTGERFFSDIPLGANETITLYFTLKNKQLTSFIRSYELWLKGDGVTSSYAQEVCANMMGYDYATLPQLQKDIVNDYLEYFYSKELAAANPNEAEMAILKLQLDYIEFIAESQP